MNLDFKIDETLDEGLKLWRYMDLAKLMEKSQTVPLVVGTLVTTAKQLDPAVPAGIYTLLYRNEGMTSELKGAIKEGVKELAALRKAKAKEGDAPAAGPEEKGRAGKAQKDGWREVLARYGLTEKDLEPKNAASDLDFVRIDDVQIPTDRSCFLLFGGPEVKIVAIVQAPKQEPTLASPLASTLLLEADSKGKAVAKLQFAVPLKQQDPKRLVQFQFHVTLDQAPPTPEAPWRLPGH